MKFKSLDNAIVNMVVEEANLHDAVACVLLDGFDNETYTGCSNAANIEHNIADFLASVDYIIALNPESAACGGGISWKRIEERRKAKLNNWLAEE